MCIAFHPKLPSVIAGGTFNGTHEMHFIVFCSLLSSKISAYFNFVYCVCMSVTQLAILGLPFASVCECDLRRLK